MDALIEFLHNVAAHEWTRALRIFLLALAAAVVCPVIIVMTGLGGDSASWSPLVIKTILILGVLCPLLWPLTIYRYNSITAGHHVAISEWWYCAIPVIVITAVILFFGIFETTRPLGIALGLVINSVAVLVIGVYAFSGRLIYAITVEAPTSAEVRVADAEIPAKAMFRTVLSILVWEFAMAWYLTAFNGQLTIRTGMFAILSLVIIALTSYSLGLKGELGQKILMYGAITIFVGILLLLVDKLLNDQTFTDFLTSGYIGSQLKSLKTSDIGIVGWIAILIFIDLMGTTIAYWTEKLVIRHTTFAIVMTSTIYLVGTWITTTSFSLELVIKKITAALNPAIQTLSNDVVIVLLLAAIVIAVASAVAMIHRIHAGSFPAVPTALFALATFAFYQLLFVAKLLNI